MGRRVGGEEERLAEPIGDHVVSEELEVLSVPRLVIVAEVTVLVLHLKRREKHSRYSVLRWLKDCCEPSFLGAHSMDTILALSDWWTIIQVNIFALNLKLH